MSIFSRISDTFHGVVDGLNNTFKVMNATVPAPAPLQSINSGLQAGSKAVSKVANKFGQVSTAMYDNWVKPELDAKVSSGMELGQAVGNALSNHAGSSSTVPITSDAGMSLSVPAQDVNYLNADLAKAYGMDASTAYQEALSNTSYQRAVSDLQKAGLNPALLYGSLQGSSSGVYAPAQLGSDGVSTGVSSAKSSHDYYKKFSNFGGLIGAGVGALTGGVKGSYFGSKVGSSVGGAFGNLFDLQ